MMRQFEKLRLDDNLGGGYGQKQRFQAYVYEEYKTYGKFLEEEKEEYRFGGRHQQLKLQGDRGPIFGYGPAYKEDEEEYLFGGRQAASTAGGDRRYDLRYGPVYKEDEEYRFRGRSVALAAGGDRGHDHDHDLRHGPVYKDEESYGKRQMHLMQNNTSASPLKYKVSSADEEEEEEEEVVDEEDDYRVRLRQYLMQHQGKDKEEDEEEYRRYESAQHRNNGRDHPASLKLAHPMTAPKNNKLSTDGWRGRSREESQREIMRHEDRLVVPQIITRMVFAKPPGTAGQSGGATAKAPERKWMEPPAAAAAAVGSWRIQRGGYIEAKSVRKGLSSNFQV